jgi:sec-independent protein translocase protein TatA
MGLDNPLHIAFLVVILLLIFGAKRLPEIGRSLGSGMREFKQTVTGETTTQHTALPAAQQPAPQMPAVQSTPSPFAQQETPVAQPAPVAVAQPAPAAVAQPAPVPVAEPAAPAQPVEHQQQSS